MNTVADTSTLGWVKREVDAALQEARTALNDYAENPGDASPLAACAGNLDQVRGVLAVLELEGPEWLTSEMEAVVEWLRRGEAEVPEHSVEPLVRVLLQLPDYLESLQDGAPDRPLVLLPLINDLRRARGEAPLEEADLFRPDLRVAPPPAAGADPADTLRTAQKQRSRYQAGLLKVLQGKEVA
ncbi:MAG TPA: hypothetical protein VKA64_08555, partial [Gammaproteobacteria bacterium]|nr:hypothetical protein [Gammaproteobacteria bacterium]